MFIHSYVVAFIIIDVNFYFIFHIQGLSSGWAGVRADEGDGRQQTGHQPQAVDKDRCEVLTSAPRFDGPKDA